MKKFLLSIICALLPIFASAQNSYWDELQSTIEYGTDVLSQARASGNVDQWMLEELEMFLQRGNEMYKEQTATEEEVRNMIEDLSWRIHEVEEAMRGGGGEEPYAVLSDNNTVLTFYYDDQKTARGGMDVGPFTEESQRGWWENTGSIINSIVFDESFANCTTITSTRYWFDGLYNLTTIIGLENLKTDNVTDMGYMFYGCSDLTDLDLSTFNTENVTDMNRMFMSCTSLTSLKVSEFNTSNVTNMSRMFEGLIYLTSIDLSGFNTSKTTDLSFMFLGCSSLTSLDLSTFNTANVSTMEEMFSGCSSLTTLDLSSFNTAQVTSMENMFSSNNELETIFVGNKWSTAGAEGAAMFSGCSKLVGGAGTTYDENHTGIEYAHIDGGVDNPGYLTRSGSGEEEPYAVLSENNTVLTFYYDNEKDARGGMDVGPFSDRETRGWNDARESITSVIFDESFANYTSLSSTAFWFIECENLTTIKSISNLKTDNVTDMSYMFQNCHGLTSLDVSGFMTENVTDMSYMFNRCSGLTSLNVSGFNTAKVTKMEGMFMECSLKSLDLSGFNTSNVTAIPYMFLGCTALTKIYVSNDWTTDNVEEGNEMFGQCTALVGGAGTKYDENHVDKTYAHIDGGTSNPGYLTDINGRSEAYFQNYTAYVYGNATLDDAFAVVGREAAVKKIAAIVWESSNELTSDQLQGITNPNLLVYVNDASIVPDSIQNVIVNGTAEEIILTDATGNNNFYCPQSFTAKSISYSRDFSQTTEIEVSRGWETIALPFDVQSITHESHGTLVPFGGEDSGYHFWLRQLSDNGLARATQIEANRPYLISMPNNSIYPSVYNQNGKITFSASDVTVPETMPQSDSYAGVTLYATFQQVAQGSSIYALNVGEARGEYPEGSVFEHNYRDIRPFQAYTTHSAGTRFITLGSLGGNDDATGIQELKVENSEFRDAEGAWYSLDGRRLYTKPTRKGVYVKDGRKIVIK